MARKATVSVPASQAAMFNRIVARMESNADEARYLVALLEAIESVGIRNREVMRSAFVSNLAATAPWLVDLAVRRTA